MKQKFIEAVRNKDIYTIKSYITSEIIEDPTFSRSNLEECIAYVRKNNVDIFEEYKPTPCETEIHNDVSQWDRALFYNKVEDLLHNFAFVERIEAIKKIGRVVYKDKANSTPSFPNAPKSQRSAKKNKRLPIAMALVIILLVILAVVLINK